MILLSVIVPMYNVEKYIVKCLRSVLDNDLDPADFEIVVVDDESPDNSLALVNSMFREYPNVKVISQKNLGLGGARNTGIRQASGEYLLFLDSDDWLLPGTLRHLVGLASKQKLDFLEFAAQGVNPDGKVAYHFTASTSGEVLDGVTYYNQVRYMNSACNKLYRREFLIQNSLFFLERIFIEDFEFNTRVLLAAQNVAATDFLVPQFLQSPDSITRNTNEKKQQKMVSDIFQVLEITRNLHQSSPKKGSETDAFFLERAGFIVATLFFQLFKNQATFAEIASLKNSLKEKNLFFVDYPLHQRGKNLFRMLLLKNFLLFRFVHNTRRLLA